MKFRPSEGTVGVEYELQLVDDDTMKLVDGIVPLLACMPSTPYVKPEATQGVVEILSPPCTGVDAVARSLGGLMTEVRAACQRLHMRLSGGGTHAACRRLGAITPLPRYQALWSRIGILGQTVVSFSLQVHVGLASAEQAATAMQELRGFLPVLIALSAGSPFWQGRDTGHAAFRHRLLATGRNYGIPPRFQSARDIEEFFAAADHAAVMRSWRDVHWDIRPRPDFGTVEIRVMDSPATLTEALGLAAFARALTVYLLRTPAARRSRLLPVPLPDWMERENHFQAAHLALDAPYVCGGHLALRKLGDVVDASLDAVWPTADELGDGAFLAALASRRDRAASHARQREVYRRQRSLREVVAALTREFDDDLRAHRPHDAPQPERPPAPFS
jgi:carboxylate-amine ligase